MNPPNSPPSRLPGASHKKKGIALVIVLAMLVLLSALIVAFVTSAATENSAAKIYSQGLEARQAAESATNLVIAQIRDATSLESNTTAWISQPGAIRTVSNSGGQETVFKLYSSDKMQQAAGSYDPNKAVLEAGLDTSLDPSKPVDGFVDLNEPSYVLTADSSPASPTYEARYPIVNPYGKYVFNGSTSRFTTTTEPAVPGTGAVEGFYCKDYKDPNHKDAYGNAVPLLPMRTRWLYILKDGTIAAYNDATKRIEKATKENPPVARTAFWTDDESCKLNINTATEGTYWDTPSVTSLQESGHMDGSGYATDKPTDLLLNLAMCQPARTEYQRFPGHPATTCLSPALRWIFYDNSTDPITQLPRFPYPVATGFPDISFKEAIYRMAPRVIGETSSATDPSRANSSMAAMRRPNKPGAGVAARVPDSDRLYASVDEYFFRPDRTGRDYKAINDDALKLDVATKGLTPENLDKLRFFLTANSRAPELTAGGRPRVGIWPINESAKHRSAFDDLIEYCARIGGKGGKAYMFTRQDPNSATNDFTNIARNAEVYRYLQFETGLPVPSSSKTLLQKFDNGASGGTAGNRDQILTEIFDYIRSTNLVDTGIASRGSVNPVRTDGLALNPTDYQYPLSYTRFFWSVAENTDTSYGSGMVVPIHLSALDNRDGAGKPTQFFGRFVTPNEIGILFYRVGTVTAGQPVQMRALVLTEMYTPDCAYPGMAERYLVKISFPNVATPGSTEFQVMPAGAVITSASKLNFPTSATNVVDVDAYTGPVGRMFMPGRGFISQMLTVAPGGTWQTAPKTFPPGIPAVPYVPPASPDPRIYPFVSNTVTLPANTTRFAFLGGTMTIEIYSRQPAPNINAAKDLIQSITVKIPDNNSVATNNYLPVPTSSDFATRMGFGINGARNQNSANTNTAPNSGYRWIEAGDVIRSLDLSGKNVRGDSRISGGMPLIIDPNNDVFAPRGNSVTTLGILSYATAKPFENSTLFRVHGFRMGRGGYFSPSTLTDNQPDLGLADGTLVAGQAGSRRPDRTPKLPMGMDGVKMGNGQPGDFGRGISKNIDGPFIGRADEGNVNFEPASGNLGIPYYLGFSGFSEVGPTYFSPNRLMPSPVMFGSLPSRLNPSTVDASGTGPWETLLFRPATTTGEHRGADDPADHYLLDLFTMPVVEPYAISEPLSTAGRVNINYVVAPFGYVKTGSGNTAATYLERKTSLHGLLKPVKMLVVPNNASQFAHGPDDPTATTSKFRYDIDRALTIKEIDKRIAAKGLFKTASEICEVGLYPLNPQIPVSNFDAFWKQNQQTGDNQRERPYALLYPRITTKSNVYTVYMRAQSLRLNTAIRTGTGGKGYDEFDEKRDLVAGEYRGSTTIERFIDPNEATLNTYDPVKNGSLDKYFRFRVINTKQFKP